MYYIVNNAGHTEGPYPSDWIKQHATAATLVSHNQKWVRFDSHPDFRLTTGSSIVTTGPDCPGCDTARTHGLSFCTTCGRKVEMGVGMNRQSPSPNLALLNLLFPGVAQIAFGQVAKGIVMLAISLVTFPTVVIPLLIIVLAVIDGYKVGGKLRRTGSVGAWEFFPA